MTDTLDPASGTAAAPASERYGPCVQTRYISAYKVARMIVSVGVFIRTASFILALIVVVLVLSSVNGAASHPDSNRSYGQRSGSDMGSWNLPTGILGGVIVGVSGFTIAAVIYLFGLLISAQGQILKATLDGAVNSSPFLSDQQRAKVMSLG